MSVRERKPKMVEKLAILSAIIYTLLLISPLAGKCQTQENENSSVAAVLSCYCFIIVAAVIESVKGW